MREHLTLEELKRLVRGDAQRGPALVDALVHLRTCNACKRKVLLGVPDAARTFLATAFPSLGTATTPWEIEIPPAPERDGPSATGWDDWAEARRRTLAEENDAPEHYRALIRQPPKHRPLWIRNHPRYQTLGLANLCLRTAKAHVHRDAGVSEEHARLAVQVLDALPETTYGAELLADRKALAWAYLANAQRARGNLVVAIGNLIQAEGWRLQGQGDPWEHAWLTRFRASFLRAFQWFDAAHARVRLASRLFLRLGELREVAAMVVETARIFGEDGEDDAAVELLEGFRTRSVFATLPHEIRCAALQNLISSYGRLGRTFEARRHLPEAQRLARHLDQPLTTARVRWAEATVLQAEGRTRSAITAFHEVQDICFDRRHGFDAALATLDLAILHLHDGNTAAVQQLTDELWPILLWVGLPCGWFGPPHLLDEEDEPQKDAPREGRAS